MLKIRNLFEVDGVLFSGYFYQEDANLLEVMLTLNPIRAMQIGDVILGYDAKDPYDDDLKDRHIVVARVTESGVTKEKEWSLNHLERRYLSDCFLQFAKKNLHSKPHWMHDQVIGWGENPPRDDSALAEFVKKYLGDE